MRRLGRRGDLPRDSAQALPAGSDRPPVDDWQAYGDRGFGQRCSALTDLTPQTVELLELV